MSSNRRHYVRLNGPKDEPLEVTSWSVEGSWLRLVEDKGNTVITTLIPASWPMSIGITTVYDD